MKLSSTVLVAAALPFASFSDVSSKPSGEAKENYQRGVQCEESGGVKEYAAAARFYRQAAAAGYAPARYDLAQLYEQGLGVARDPQQAAVWYRKAAEQGDAEARNNLGALFAFAHGVPHSDAAVRWYRAAAQRDDPEAICNLAMMYLQARGVSRDLHHAFDLFQTAAEQGYAVAQNNLALMYANGQSVASGFHVGMTWVALAAEQLSGCAELRDRIGKEMRPDEIARSPELAARKRVEVQQQQRESK